MRRGCRRWPASSPLRPNSCSASTASTSGIRRALPSSSCCSRNTVCGYRLANGAPPFGAQRSDIALFFLGSHAALLLARAVWLGDPLAIPLHQLQSGSLLIFAFFMISDPRTAPDSRLGRLFFALGVAALGHYLAFFMQMRPALYVALIALSPLTLLLDRIIPAKRFAWIPQGASR